MKLLTASEIKAWDIATMQEQGITSLQLMERASRNLVSHLKKLCTKKEQLCFLCGPGNNGGDGIAMARMMHSAGYSVQVKVFHVGKMSVEMQHNLDVFKSLSPENISEFTPLELPDLQHYSLIIDALFGTGIKRPLTADWRRLIEHINDFRKNVISIDMPSGMPAEWASLVEDWPSIRACRTLSIELPKCSFFSREGYRLTGEWETVSIDLVPYLKPESDSKTIWIRPEAFLRHFPLRRRFDHKGDFGHALLMGGSLGMAGAAVMASKSALRAGCGLVSVLLEESLMPILHAAVPQAMCVYKTDQHKYKAIAAGPGIGKSQFVKEELKRVIQYAMDNELPLLLDADALNILSESREFPRGPAVLYTPHLGEFDRMMGTVARNDFERMEAAASWANKHRAYLLLKGGYSVLFSPDGNRYVFSDGHPSLAKAGSGDVLTGIILALLAQGLEVKDAACLGLVIHGAAARLASEQTGMAGMCIEDLIFGISSYLKQCGY